jgi:hypothetical protein
MQRKLILLLKLRALGCASTLIVAFNDTDYRRSKQDKRDETLLHRVDSGRSQNRQRIRPKSVVASAS